MPKKQKPERLTISKARKTLGMIARNYSDDDILEIIQLMKSVAEIAYEDGNES